MTCRIRYQKFGH